MLRPRAVRGQGYLQGQVSKERYKIGKRSTHILVGFQGKCKFGIKICSSWNFVSRMSIEGYEPLAIFEKQNLLSTHVYRDVSTESYL